MPSVDDPDALVDLAAEVTRLRDAMLHAERERADDIDAVHPLHRRSAANLVHYVELRKHDIRHLQTRLGLLGLSSLGRSESSVLATIDAVLVALAGLLGFEAPARIARVGIEEGNSILEYNAARLLGPSTERRSTRIMVTLPSEAAVGVDVIEGLVARGMDVARVNCAHDDAEAWSPMITTVRATANAAGHRCRVAMDLGGPKLRTGPLAAGPRLVKISPRRDVSGRVVDPATAWLSASAGPTPSGVVPAVAESGASTVVIPVDDLEWLARRRPGERLGLVDARGSLRRWNVVHVEEGGCLVSIQKTTYVSTGIRIAVDGDAAAVGDLPQLEQKHRVHLGERVVLTRSMAPAPATLPGADHFIGCSLPEVFESAGLGERVWLDDGKIGGTIEYVDDDSIVVAVTDVRPGGANLRGGKGINLPDTDLRIDALTEKDRDDLVFVAEHADMVNLSFVQHPSDVERLQYELAALGAEDVGIVLKIESAIAFANLPELLLVAMRSPTIGVMIARGDLAVEVGFDRLAEVQEEIMWACEAGHVPVIWATQVLDSLAKTGQASRAEVTDAAMSVRAECVMLNKGPYIGEAIDVLDSILVRMQDHHDKKRSMLRRLTAWDRPAGASV